MKPFDLEKALAGARVVTRSGKEVTQLRKFETESEYCLVAVVDGRIKSFTIQGVFNCGANAEYDLFMAPEKREYWCNVYKYDNGNIVVSLPYKTQKGAENGKINCAKIVATIKVWEEEI